MRGRDVNRVTDQCELELASSTNGSSDHHPCVDPYTNTQRPAEPVDDETMNLNRRVYGGIGMVSRSFGAPNTASAPSPRNRYLAALTSEHVVALFEQPSRECGIDLSAKCALKSLPLSQTRLHAVE